MAVDKELKQKVILEITEINAEKECHQITGGEVR